MYHDWRVTTHVLFALLGLFAQPSKGGIELSSYALNLSTASKQFLKDYKKEIQQNDFLARIEEDMRSEFLSLVRKQRLTDLDDSKPAGSSGSSSDDWGPELAMFNIDTRYDNARTFFHGFYEWARTNKKKKYSKSEALKIAEGCYVKMVFFMKTCDMDPTAFFHDYAFVQAINQECSLGYSSRQLRDRVWKRLQPKFKPGKTASESYLPIKMLDDYNQILGIVSPPFKKQLGLSRKNNQKKYPAFLSAIEFVNSQMDENDQIDEDEFVEKMFVCRKAERIAIILTARLHNKSIETVERAIGRRRK